MAPAPGTSGEIKCGLKSGVTFVQPVHYLHLWKQVRAGDETRGMKTEVSTKLVHTLAKKIQAQQLPLGSCAAGTVVSFGTECHCSGSLATTQPTAVRQLSMAEMMATILLINHLPYLVYLKATPKLGDIHPGSSPWPNASSERRKGLSLSPCFPSVNGKQCCLDHTFTVALSDLTSYK